MGQRGSSVGYYLNDDKLVTFVGAINEWTLYGTGTAFHPLHIHVNHFQVVSWTSAFDAGEENYYRVGQWRDTIPPVADKLTIRFMAADFVGETIMHCHFQRHEDLGMMDSYLVTDKATYDSVYTKAPTVAPTTAAPTSSAPTPAPTTAAPTSSAPTPAPTTVSPTLAPSTVQPTTSSPTMKPTSSAPSLAPSTSSTTTSSPTASPTTANPTVAPTSSAPTTAAPSRDRDEKEEDHVALDDALDDDAVNTCFAASTTIQLEGGDEKQISEIRVGDRVLVYNPASEAFLYEDVVFVPHEPENAVDLLHVRLVTAKRSLLLTVEHLVMRALCETSASPLPADFSLVPARTIAHATVAAATADGQGGGWCLLTVDGVEPIQEAHVQQGKGVFMIVTAEWSGLIVADGVVASSFGTNHIAANLYYHIHRLLYAYVLPTWVVEHSYSRTISMASTAIAVFHSKSIWMR